MWVPLGLGYIAAVLEQEGHRVEIIDMNMERISQKELQRRVKDASIVGITGMITEYQEVLKITDAIKKVNEKMKVVLGGPLATTLPGELLQVSQADFIVIGEGERTMSSLVSALEHGSSFAGIRGIAYKDDGKQIILTEPVMPIADLDTIPFPARRLLNMNRYLKNHFDSFGLKLKEFGKIQSTNIITSRGCPYSCTFCFKDMWGYKWRRRSPANIIEEMELLYQRYGINGFFFNDDTFVLDRKRIFQFCDLLQRKGLDVVWYCNGRVNLMTKELLRAMYEAGCRAIAYGIESGNQQILDSMKKNQTLEQTRSVVEWTKEARINACGYFMIGMLDETKATIEQTIAFARELELDFYGFSITTPLPGTELYNAARQRGLIPKNVDSFGEWDLHVNANLTQDCSDKDLTAFEKEAFKEFYLKSFGRYYMLNPGFWREAIRLVLSIRNQNQVRELILRAWGVAQTYWHKD